MRKVLLIILIFLSLLALFIRFGTNPLLKSLGLESRAGLRVEANKKAKVFICQAQNPSCQASPQDLGSTPYQDENLSQGQYLVFLKDEESTDSAKEKFAWKGYVKLNSGTLSVVNRELAQTKAVSSGEVITLEKGKGVTLISTPSSAQVTMDGKDLGRTPISISEIEVGEHQFLISKDNFLKRSIRATLVEGFNLTINVDLAIAEVDLSKIPTEPIIKTPQVLIKQTPTGFLRVRAEANINSAEIGRVTPGETLVLLEEIPNWNKIRTKDGKEGYVSSSYTEKKE